MDKYEYNLKLDHMKALLAEQKYHSAAEIADTINWRKIKNVTALVRAGEIYENVGRFEESKELLMIAYERSPIGRKIIYRLAQIAIKTSNFDEAREYYNEFVEIAPHDNLKYVLKYEINKAEGADYQTLIENLEELKEQEFSEEWGYELAQLYHQAGMSEQCIEICDEIILYFGTGEYVERALELKMLYQPLTPSQEEKYRIFNKQKNGIVEVRPDDSLESGEIVNETMQIPNVEVSAERFNTQNLQEELQKSMKRLFDSTDDEDAEANREALRMLTEEISYLHMSDEAEKKEDIKVSEKPDESKNADVFEEKEILEDVIISEVSENDEIFEEVVIPEVPESDKIFEEVVIPEVSESDESFEEVPVSEVFESDEIFEEVPVPEVSESDEIFEEVPVPEVSESDEVFEEVAVSEISEKMEILEEITEINEPEAVRTVEEKPEEILKSSQQIEPVHISKEDMLAELENIKKAVEKALQEAKQQILEAAKAADLEETVDIMDRLAGIIPTIDAAVVSRGAIVSKATPEKEHAEQMVANMNQLLQKEIEHLTPEDKQEESSFIDISDVELTHKLWEEEKSEEEPVFETEEWLPKVEFPTDLEVSIQIEEEESVRDAEENVVYNMESLTEEQRKQFSYFIPVRGMEEQIYKALNGIASRLMQGETARTGNLIIDGSSGGGKTTLATNFIRVLQQKTGKPDGKIGKIQAEVLNKKDIDALFARISGGCLIIECAGDLKKDVAAKLADLLENDTKGTLFILEDTKHGVERIMLRDKAFASRFSERISIPIFTSDELVAFGKSYAAENGYSIDEMGILALYNCISNIQKIDCETTVAEVKDIVDDAIANAERGAIRKAFSILSAKRFDAEDYVILHEKDFNN